MSPTRMVPVGLAQPCSVRRLPESNRCLAPEKTGADFRVLQPLRGNRPAFAIEADGCWIWQGSLNSKGYPLRRSNATGHLLVHRAVYEALHGELSTELQVHHRCRNEACVNPAHLEARAHLDHERLHAGEQNRAAVILAALAAGPKRFRDLEDAVRQAGHTSGATALTRMAGRGEIVRLRHGLYSLPKVAAGVTYPTGRF